MADSVHGATRTETTGDTDMNNNAILSQPPEGVLAGEDVPRGSEPDAYEETKLQRVVGTLKTRPEYRKHTDGELREIAKELLDTGGEL